MWWTPHHWMIGGGGHRVSGWFEFWCSYGGVVDTASLDDWRLLKFLWMCGGQRVMDDWSFGVLKEVWWTPHHCMIGVLEFLHRCGGHCVTEWLESWSSYGGVVDTATFDDWNLGVLTEVWWILRHCVVGVLEFLRRCGGRWTLHHWVIRVLEFLRSCSGHRVIGWLESWSSYGGMLIIIIIIIIIIIMVPKSRTPPTSVWPPPKIRRHRSVEQMADKRGFVCRNRGHFNSNTGPSHTNKKLREIYFEAAKHRWAMQKMPKRIGDDPTHYCRLWATSTYWVCRETWWISLSYPSESGRISWLHWRQKSTL